jgi:hypothetical protein
MRVPWHLTMRETPLLRRNRDGRFLDRLDRVAREIDDRAAAGLGGRFAREDPEGQVTFLRVGGRVTFRR